MEEQDEGKYRILNQEVINTMIIKGPIEVKGGMSSLFEYIRDNYLGGKDGEGLKTRLPFKAKGWKSSRMPPGITMKDVEGKPDKPEKPEVPKPKELEVKAETVSVVENMIEKLKTPTVEKPKKRGRKRKGG